LIKALSTRTGPEGRPEFLEALRLARLHGDEWLEMRVLWLSAFADRVRVESRSNERLAHLAQADEIARRLGDFPDEMWIRFLMQGELLSRGRVDEAVDLAQRMNETAQRQGDLIDRLRAHAAGLYVAFHRAEWEKVRELSGEILEQSPPLYLADGWYLRLRCEAACHRGDFTVARQDLLRLVETTHGVPRVPADIFLNCALAITSVSKVTGDTSLLPEAYAFARLILEIPDINEAKERSAHAILGRICVLRADAAGAAAEHDYFAEQLERTPEEDRLFSHAHELLASLSAVRGDLDRAVAHYEDSLLDAGHAVHERAWIVYDFSRVLTLRRAPGDLERARSLLDLCLETAESATLVPLAERARKALASLGGRTAHLDGLTDRETEVLALMARGLTNKEIGAKLFISAKTVDAHVRNILEKTGTANRTEAAAYAIWHDLPGV
jgi:ATP/maltotriose-dependent transcriptional regulator MalT